ncbi:hypothetical protein CC86DRAFT_410486 [Ophiobolus disseminans]|uniref:Uncharacterized protein n=1 Tax=Ophiobolus disseminans TaxID=1469910 RepID=A0A6A6ZLW0_9PLEO|nr:hypothetical protein CC86DRAFT_410486 [Ophiobolus disseminans]
MSPDFREIVNGPMRGRRDRDGYITHRWDSPSGGGTAQYWLKGDTPPIGPIPPNIHREYRRGHRDGFAPGQFRGVRHGLHRGARAGHMQGWDDAWSRGMPQFEHRRGYGNAFPHAERYGYSDTYHLFDYWDDGDYDGELDGYGYY